MGMFIISPYDKGGFLYRPSKSEFGSQSVTTLSSLTRTVAANRARGRLR